MSLLHELHHVINDFEMLESMDYHFSTPSMPDLLLNEQKADQFALDILINPIIQKKLSRVIPFPFKVKKLSNELEVSPSIIYGVYLESLVDNKTKKKMFAEFGKFLTSSEVATKNVLFDPIGKRSLIGAIDEMKKQFYKKVI